MTLILSYFFPFYGIEWMRKKKKTPVISRHEGSIRICPLLVNSEVWEYAESEEGREKCHGEVGYSKVPVPYTRGLSFNTDLL